MPNLRVFDVTVTGKKNLPDKSIPFSMSLIVTAHSHEEAKRNVLAVWDVPETCEINVFECVSPDCWLTGAKGLIPIHRK